MMMCNDPDWLIDRTSDQLNRFKQWLKKTEGMPLTIIEVGASNSVATIRRLSEDVLCRESFKETKTNLIRINP